MILKSLKSNRLKNLFFVPVFAFALWTQNLLAPFSYSLSEGDKQNILFRPLVRFFELHKAFSVWASMLLVILMALTIEAINSRYLFIRIRTRLPALIFVLLVGGLPTLHSFHPIYAASLLVLLAIYRLFAIFEAPRARSILFDSGLLLGIATLFYFNSWVLLPALLTSTAILCRERSWRQFTAPLLGYLVPLIFASSYYFITNRLGLLETLFQSNLFPRIDLLQHNHSLLIYLSVLGIFILAGSIFMAQQYDTKKVSSRKYFSAFFTFFLFSALAIIFVPAVSQEMLLFAFIPLTYLISNFLVFMKSRFWSEFYFLLLLLSVVILQFVQ